jgi:small-conductance mechanosensitive channel
VDWTGEWQTYWREGQALVVLTQHGDVVTGTYEPQGGRLEGRVEGHLLKGRWFIDQASGSFLFALSSDGKIFSGRFANDEYWNGVRVTEDQKKAFAFRAALTPRETLRTVLTAANEAVFAGNAAAMQIYEPLLIYEGDATDSRDHNRRRNLLWQVLNMSTFRIYDAPARVEGNSAVFEIGPAGSSIRYPLRFRLDESGHWKILIESEAQLRLFIKRFLDDLGYASIQAMENDRRDSPRGAMKEFIDGFHSWDSGGAKKVLGTLDLSYLPEHLRTSEGPILADYLKQIMDRTGFVIWQEIPNNPSRPTPYIHYRHPAGNLTIYRVEVEEGDKRSWLFSAETLKDAPELFSALQDLPLAPGLSEPGSVTEFFRMREAVRDVSPGLLQRTLIIENWQWLGLLVALFVSAAIGWVAGRLAYAVAYRLWQPKARDFPEEDESASKTSLAGSVNPPTTGDHAENDLPEEALVLPDTEEPLDTNDPTHFYQLPIAKARAFAWPTKVSVTGFILIYALGTIGIVEVSFEELYRLVSLITAVAFTIALYRLIDLIGHLLLVRAERTPSYVDEIVTSLVSGLVKLAVAIMGVVACAEIVELPYEGVITGLGIGGVAIAFASRETVSNMLGGALLMTDKPFKRGDLVETDGQRARVLNVGLRSTRLRRLDDTILTIPNAQLTDKAIINWGVRERRRVDLSIGLTYSTPREKLDAFVQGLKDLFKRQPDADEDDCYIGLKDFGASAIEIEFWGFFHVYNYEDHVRVRHALVGDVIELAEQIGVSFAFPTRTVHLINTPPDSESEMVSEA